MCPTKKKFWKALTAYFPLLSFKYSTLGSGVITRDELRVFYSSFLGFSTQKVGEVLDLAYNNMTSVSMALQMLTVISIS